MTTQLETEDVLGRMSLGDHLEELRLRVFLAGAGVLAGVIVMFFFGRSLMEFFCWPYAVAAEAAGIPPKLITLGPSENFMVYCKVAVLFGLLISSPWTFYQLWAFISAGLYPSERRYINVVAPASAVLFVGGAIFFIMVVARLALRFFMTFKTGVEFIEYSSGLARYIDFMVRMSLVFGLGFQLPILIVGLNKLGIVNVSQLCRYRKYVILALVTVAAVLTGPEFIQQIALAIPLYILYEASILVCRIIRKK